MTTPDLKELKKCANLCQDAMRCDQYSLQKRLRVLLKAGNTADPTTIQQWMLDLEQSLKKRQQRAINLPQPFFPEDLPVSEKRADLAALIAQHPVVIVAGETGSGKTTQIPKICLTLGRGISGLIGCTQPRRIAARTVAQRVANELTSPLGHIVGYKVRFSDRLSPDTYIKFMTDGILLAETQSDRFLEAYDTLIIDEAHERSLNIDFLIGYLKQLLPKRPDLKLIITSATIDTQRFSQHFNQAPVLQISGRTYPVEVRYRPLVSEQDEQDRNLIQGILDAVDEITAHDRQADTLIFLPGERDIRDTTEALHKHRLPHTEILPLYSRLSTTEQNRVFMDSPYRRIILATNVAETSLTVPKIKAVIDPGLARISRYSLRHKIQRLPIEPIARSSADQRKGRCGRVAPGLCIRLYSGEDYSLRPEFTDPEILRTSLATVILQMLALRLGDIYQFPFLDAPSPKLINDGFALLLELGAVDSRRQLTELGRQLARLPIDPKLGRMIIAAQQEGCLQEVLVIASALSIQDPRERPLEAQQAADLAQQIFLDEQSDFLSYVKLWNFLQEQAKHLSNNKFRQKCHEHFLSYLRIREWQDIHHQLTIQLKELGWRLNEEPATFEQIHRALLSGLLGNIGFKTESEQYLGARNLKFYLFPGSGLFKKSPKWVMAAELVETARLYARCAAKIAPEWVEQLAGHLCQHHYFEPHWEKTSTQVGAYEKVTLYGLTIVPKRKVNYGPLDPKLARTIFIQEALVNREYHCKFAFFTHNQELINEIEALEHKSRRQDILVDDLQIFNFYDQRIPEGVYSGKTFEQWLKQLSDPQLLFLKREDLMKHAGDSITAQAFPDHFLVNAEVDLALAYRFEPGHEQDGVTVTIPLPLLNQLHPEPFEWGVPGLLEEKVIALLRSLPKNIRKAFVPVPDVAKEIMEGLPQPKVSFREGGSFLEASAESLYTVLAKVCQRRLGQVLSEKSWQVESLPPHLLMNFQLVDNEGHYLGNSRNFEELQKKWGAYASEQCQLAMETVYTQRVENRALPVSSYEREHLTTWNFGDLPEQVSLVINGVKVQGFPTLLDRGDHVSLKIFDNPKLAQQEYRLGLSRLFWLSLPIKKWLKQLPFSPRLCLQYLKIGDCEQLKVDMLNTLIEGIFLAAPLPVRQQEFEQRLATGQQRLLPMAYEYVEHLVPILEEYHALTQKLALGNAKQAVLVEIRQHLQRLVYEGFVKEVSLVQLKQFPRYLKAVRIRLERWEYAPHKDVKKASQLQPLWEDYWQKQATLRPSAEKETYRWLLEELRVSLFAQELKTACPVSVAKVQKLWEELVQGEKE